MLARCAACSCSSPRVTGTDLDKLRERNGFDRRRIKRLDGQKVTGFWWAATPWDALDDRL